jgi:hypothetical protein
MTTTIHLRQATRAAIKIHERLLVPAWSRCLEYWPPAQWERLRTLLWRLRKVQSRGWQAAAREVIADVEFETQLLMSKLKTFHKELGALPKQSRMCSPGQIAADLAALADEFASVRIDLQARTITVQTEPIELEGLWLGPFDICLWWERLGVRRPYEVIAIKPQRPRKDEQVTHPHVRDNQLCEGDAVGPIKGALADGRLFDFFVLVRQTLETYNSASPYVSIDDWQGIRCHDCGSHLDTDDACTCETCDGQICDGCTISCHDCGRYACNDCTGVCSTCDFSFCHHCLADPREAAIRLCAGCRKKEEEEPDDPQCDAAALAILPVCVGQVAAAA